jgi:hypothetical protein
LRAEPEPSWYDMGIYGRQWDDIGVHPLCSIFVPFVNDKYCGLKLRIFKYFSQLSRKKRQMAYKPGSVPGKTGRRPFI